MLCNGGIENLVVVGLSFRNCSGKRTLANFNHSFGLDISILRLQVSRTIKGRFYCVSKINLAVLNRNGE